MEERRKNSRTIITSLILLIIFVLILVLFLYLIRNPAIFGSFAKSDSVSVSPTATTKDIAPQNISVDNSYLFASPLRAAVGVERVRVTAYILDGQGMGVAGKKVILGNSNSALTIYPVSDVTDESGRATFDIMASQAGLFSIEASTDGKNLSQKVTVTFN